MKFTAILLSSILLGLVIGGCHSGQKVPEGEFLIEGFVKNLPDSSIVPSFSLKTESMRPLCYLIRLQMAGLC